MSRSPMPFTSRYQRREIVFAGDRRLSFRSRIGPRLRGRDDDLEDDDNGESAIADFLRERLSAEDFAAVMRALATGGAGGREATEDALGSAGQTNRSGGEFDLENGLRDTDGSPTPSSADRRRRAGDRERARDTMRSGVLPSALTAQDALPSKSAEADFADASPAQACQRTVPTATAGNRYETRPRHSIRTDPQPGHAKRWPLRLLPAMPKPPGCKKRKRQSHGWANWSLPPNSD